MIIIIVVIIGTSSLQAAAAATVLGPMSQHNNVQHTQKTKHNGINLPIKGFHICLYWG